MTLPYSNQTSYYKQSSIKDDYKYLCWIKKQSSFGILRWSKKNRERYASILDHECFRLMLRVEYCSDCMPEVKNMYFNKIKKLVPKELKEYCSNKQCYKDLYTKNDTIKSLVTLHCFYKGKSIPDFIVDKLVQLIKEVDLEKSQEFFLNKNAYMKAYVNLSFCGFLDVVEIPLFAALLEDEDDRIRNYAMAEKRRYSMRNILKKRLNSRYPKDEAMLTS